MSKLIRCKKNNINNSNIESKYNESDMNGSMGKYQHRKILNFYLYEIRGDGRCLYWSLESAVQGKACDEASVVKLQTSLRDAYEYAGELFLNCYNQVTSKNDKDFECISNAKKYDLTKAFNELEPDAYVIATEDSDNKLDILIKRNTGKKQEQYKRSLKIRQLMSSNNTESYDPFYILKCLFEGAEHPNGMHVKAPKTFREYLSTFYRMWGGIAEINVFSHIFKRIVLVVSPSIKNPPYRLWPCMGNLLGKKKIQTLTYCDDINDWNERIPEIKLTAQLIKERKDRINIDLPTKKIIEIKDWKISEGISQKQHLIWKEHEHEKGFEDLTDKERIEFKEIVIYSVGLEGGHFQLLSPKITKDDHERDNELFKIRDDFGKLKIKSELQKKYLLYSQLKTNKYTIKYKKYKNKYLKLKEQLSKYQ
jgi:hypothetical protein